MKAVHLSHLLHHYKTSSPHATLLCTKSTFGTCNNSVSSAQVISHHRRYKRSPFLLWQAAQVLSFACYASASLSALVMTGLDLLCWWISLRQTLCILQCSQPQLQQQQVLQALSCWQMTVLLLMVASLSRSQAKSSARPALQLAGQNRL